MNSPVSGNHDMPGMKYPFDHRERSFNASPNSTNRPVSPLVLFRQWFPPDGSFHGFIHRSKRCCTEVSLIPVNRFPFLGEIDLAIMYRCSCCVKSPNELKFFIDDRVNFVSEL